MSVRTSDSTLELLAALERRGQEPVAFGADGPRSARELLALAARIAERLPEPTPGSEVCFSIDRDRFGLAAGLLATWSRGHTAALPRDGTRDHVFPVYVRAQRVELVQDTGIQVGIDVGRAARVAAGAASLAADPGDGRPALRAFHQPAPGESEERSWSAAELLAEARRLADELGLVPGLPVASTIAPLVPASLWLGLLAPLVAGAPFAAGTWAPAEAGGPGGLERWLAAHPGARLVTSPAHARALVRAGARDAPGPELGALVVVDEGPDATTAAACRERFGATTVRAPRVPFDAREPARHAALREALFARAEVRDAALVAWREQPGEPPVDLVAVAAPQEERSELEALLREHFDAGGADEPGARSELCLLPRLPRDPDGRLEPWRVALEFGYGRSGPRLERELEWEDAPGAGDAAAPEHRFHTRLPQAYAFLEGHYTGWPVLAGVVQLTELVLPCARRVLPPQLTGAGLERVSGLKFLDRISAGESLEVRLRPGEGERARELAFEIHSGERRCSVGKLLFAAGERSA